MTTIQPPLWLTIFLLLIYVLSLHYKLMIGCPYHNTAAPKLPPYQPHPISMTTHPPSTLSNFYNRLPLQLMSHRVARLPDKVHNFLRHFCSWPLEGQQRNKNVFNCCKGLKRWKIRRMCSTIKCSLSPHFLLIFFCCMFCLFLFIDGIKSYALFLCGYECLNHVKNIHDMCEKSIFMFPEIIKNVHFCMISFKNWWLGSISEFYHSKNYEKTLVAMDRYSYVHAYRLF
jgi:hypothetical protein